MDTLVCLAVNCEKLGRDPQIEKHSCEVHEMRGDADAYAYAEIYAHGDMPGALSHEPAIRAGARAVVDGPDPVIRSWLSTRLYEL